ncbi:hypothetical protein [Mesorhizobium sp.]|uniref:hypothetical protein n=1 Tax=Mesorhizobium sp. TaxID=1871066 RepID=UPI00257ED9C5|nr:hypothetical protein [Mesorhizobium sp.]
MAQQLQCSQVFVALKSTRSAELKISVLFLECPMSLACFRQPLRRALRVECSQANLDRFCAVIVDDFRLFGVEPGWPRKAEVMEKLEDVLPAPEWIHGVLNDQFIAVRKRTAK